ncbi:MAG: sensor histidine kinase [Desulfovibrio sp.]
MTRELTRFASPERASTEEIQSQFEAFLSYDCMGFLDMLPSLFLVLNAQRQIVFYSSDVLALLGKEESSEIVGQRVGELFQCVHSDNEFSGCGTGEPCRQCGAVAAILSALGGEDVCKECRMMRRNGTTLEALDLRVHGKPLEFRGQLFSIMTVEDISHEKWRDALERTFFHDILNIAGGLKGLVAIMADVMPQDYSREASVLKDAFTRMVDEICTHRDLMAAEQDNLDLNYIEFDSKLLLEDVIRLFSMHPLASGRALDVDPDAQDFPLESDRTLLVRILGNMVKNALEASAPGGPVVLNCQQEDESMVFSVNNQGEIPRAVQTQIFQRSFSTKGKGRGLGTYSIRLLSEKCLKGVAGFNSDELSGTTFWVKIPLRKNNTPITQ